jgi:hypothetical protein
MYENGPYFAARSNASAGLIAPLSAANSIVTDDGITPALVSKIANAGPNVLVAPRVRR